MSKLRNRSLAQIWQNSYRCQSTEPRHLFSKLHHQFNEIPFNQVSKNTPKKLEEITAKSHRMLVDYGLIRPLHTGSFAFLPLAQRSLEKLQFLIDQQMFKIGANKITLPTMTDGKLWKKSGRWKLINEELFKLKNRHDNDLVLGPTFEEAITKMVADFGIVSSHDLPMKYYQISNKFRDEMRAKYGLIRSKEFVMKDLYTFDANLENAVETYELVNECYEELFDKIGVPYVKVEGETGAIGGSMSHEYHFLSDIGQDDILKCQDCNFGSNSELLKALEDKSKCPKCPKNENSVHDCNLVNSKGIEVGHTFLLGDKYSKIFKARFQGGQGKPEVLQMGCYGLGVSRILAASVEVLSSENCLVWPESIVPYKIAILAPKAGSKEDIATPEVFKLYDQLVNQNEYENDVIIDDRPSITVGKKLRDAKKLGYTYVILFGKECIDANNPVIELYHKNEMLKMPANQVLFHLENK